MRWSFAVVAALALFVARPIVAHACSCMEIGVEDARAGADVVFEGRAITLDATATAVTVTFAVTQGWKGEIHERMTVVTAPSSSMCGVEFRRDEVYLVYARRNDDDVYTTGLCARTARMDEAEADRMVLGPGVIPVDVEDDPASTPPARTMPEPRHRGCAGCSTPAPSSHVPSSLALVVALFVARRRTRR